jgi:uncharacterized membrane protein
MTVAQWRTGSMLALALAGLGVAAYLTVVALTRGPLACGFLGDCQAVQGSVFASVRGIPLAAFGLGMYVALAAMLAFRLARPEQVGLQLLVFGLSLSGVLYSVYLTYLELFVIGAICIWCVTSAVIVAAILVLATAELLPQVS